MLYSMIMTTTFRSFWVRLCFTFVECFSTKRYVFLIKNKLSNQDSRFEISRNRRRHWWTEHIWNTQTKSLVISLALSFGFSNAIRLPQQAMLVGPLPYLFVYTIVCVTIGIPLALLEISLGQFCEEGIVSVWRAVPIFKGLGYVKFMIMLLTTTYITIYAAIATGYLIWIAIGDLPIKECQDVHITPEGYDNRAVGIECLKRTFLLPMNENPSWFGLITVIVFCLWLISGLSFYKQYKTFIRSLYCLLLLIMICGLVVTVTAGTDNLKAFFYDGKWSVLLESSVWYSATLQMFFSTHVGFGYLHTAAGNIYKGSDCLYTSVMHMVCSCIIGCIAVIFWYRVGDTMNNKSPSVVYILLLIYDSAVSKDNNIVWPILAYCIVLFSCCITIIALLFPVYYSLHNAFRSTWRIIATVISFLGGLTTIAMFTQGLMLVEMLDKYIIPLLLVSTISMEIYSFLFFYGCKKWLRDLEFLTNNRQSTRWLFLWVLCPLLVGAACFWRILDYLSKGWQLEFEPIEIYFLVTIVILKIVIFVFSAIFIIAKQVEYNLCEKIKASFNAAADWGPVNIVYRHLWIQYKDNPNMDGSYRINEAGPINEFVSLPQRNFMESESNNLVLAHSMRNSPLVVV